MDESTISANEFKAGEILLLEVVDFSNHLLGRAVNRQPGYRAGGGMQRRSVARSERAHTNDAQNHART